ncbi:MAG: ABC transporter permease [Candidatus Marinimicrobia bacterium]|nr:ABC transporter permease [Candidatus Neomarinimicrobiota bacterium]
MRTILFILQKEFLQIFRNRMMLPIIFVLPLVQMLILVNAATMEMKNLNIFVIDRDYSTTSRKLVGKFAASPFFRITGQSTVLSDAESSMKRGKTDIILNIPANFEKRLVKENRAEIQFLINAINGTVAGIGYGYAASITSGFNREIVSEWQKIPAGTIGAQSIQVKSSFWYNPELNYKVFMVPAVLAILVTIIGAFLSGLNIVREKEIGTIEQINVTPIRKYQFVIGKLTPFLMIALVELGFGLTLGKLLFDIPITGSLFLLFGTAAIYLLVVLGLGLLVSTMAKTQQQAIFISYFFMIVFIMMSGLFTSTESMPDWALKVNVLNPVAYFIRLVRMILLKGSGISDIYRDVISLAVYGVAMLSLATWRYRKTV